ncbi:MAG: metal ABC transporter ATP-binding protein [Clostridiales bacterium]|nr:metal ABC transporter ATP-binding protein [Clostridiales bacterium]
MDEENAGQWGKENSVVDVITMEQVTFNYGEEPVLDQVNLRVEEGEYVLLTGENGSGKSTLLRILIGELKPLSGVTCIFGEDVSKVFKGAKIGYVPQNSISRNQNFPATVEEIMMTGLYGEIGRFRLPGKEHRRRVREALAAQGMEEYIHHRIGALSGGQQQRVMLARALAADPKLLILDEPTAGVDAASVKVLYQTLHQINEREGVTIFMITHGNTKECEGAGRVLRLEEGRLTEV